MENEEKIKRKKRKNLENAGEPCMKSEPLNISE